MSSSEYYAFQTVDRPLTRDEQEELRSLSTRAVITPTSFTNHYDFSSFRGDPHALLERFFDAFLHVASWGTAELSLKVPVEVLPPEDARPYLGGGDTSLNVRRHGPHTVLGWTVRSEGENWVRDFASYLGELLPLRSELMEGDLRPLYLGWLAAVSARGVDETEHEPPVPAGLSDLTAAQRALADFLLVDQDLLTAAAEASPPLSAAQPAGPALEEWLRSMPAPQQSDWLVRLATKPTSRAELVRAFRATHAPAPSAQTPRRTVKQLREAAVHAKERRVAEEARQQAEERARREREEKEAREAHLTRLAARQADAWNEAAVLALDGRGKSYLQAVTLLADLREVARREGKDAAFRERLEELRERVIRRPALLRRMADAGL